MATKKKQHIYHRLKQSHKYIIYAQNVYNNMVHLNTQNTLPRFEMTAQRKMYIIFHSYSSILTHFKEDKLDHFKFEFLW